jgi:hypothetical protein
VATVFTSNALGVGKKILPPPLGTSSENDRFTLEKLCERVGLVCGEGAVADL